MSVGVRGKAELRSTYRLQHEGRLETLLVRVEAFKRLQQAGVCVQKVWVRNGQRHICRKKNGWLGYPSKHTCRLLLTVIAGRHAAYAAWKALVVFTEARRIHVVEV